MSVLDILTKARALISDPDKWTKGAYARLPSGVSCDERNAYAEKFCMVGSINAASRCDWSKAIDARQSLFAAIKKMDRAGSVPGFNDYPSTTHTDVMNVFSEAIALELNKEQLP